VATDLVVAVDTNILLSALLTRWGSPKGTLILATRRRFRLLLVQPVEEEARLVLSARVGQRAGIRVMTSGTFLDSLLDSAVNQLTGPPRGS
jgi:hypothetical protein